VQEVRSKYVLFQAVQALIHVYLCILVNWHELQNKLSKTKWQDVEHCWKWDSYQICIALMVLRMWKDLRALETSTMCDSRSPYQGGSPFWFCITVQKSHYDIALPKYGDHISCWCPYNAPWILNFSFVASTRQEARTLRGWPFNAEVRCQGIVPSLDNYVPGSIRL